MFILYIKNLDTFEQIKYGKKTIEIRKLTDFLYKLSNKTFIMFAHQQNYCIKYIIKILKYDTLIDLLNNTQLIYINNKLKSIEDAIIHYKKYYKNINREFCSIHIK